ncbi:MAG: HEAT repeat domain-containing protein [Pirellulales bacterium]
MVAQEAFDLHIAVDRGLVSVNVESLGGATGNRLQVYVQKKTNRQLNLTLQSGTTFVAQGANVQGLAAVKLMGKYIPGNRYRRGSVMVLADNQAYAYLVQTVCIDYHKSSPRRGQHYKLHGLDVRCQRILSSPKDKSATIWSYQSAVWMDRAGVSTNDLQRKFRVKANDIHAAEKMIKHAQQLGAESLSQVDVSVKVRNRVSGLFSSDPQIRVEAFRNVQGLSEEDRNKLKVLVDVNVLRNGELPTASELQPANTLESLMPEGLNLPKLQIPESLEELSILLEGLPKHTDSGSDEKRFPKARLMPLMVGLKSRRPRLRLLAVRNVAKIQDPWAIDALIITLDDSDDRVRQAAVEGLEKLTNQTFGEDRQKWLHWWEQSQDDFDLAAAPSDP